nr:GNAT family N-acetyltransferase [Alkalicoccus daliensis]
MHLYYLTAEKRGLGMGKLLHRYALEFFSTYKVKEYHLRVSPHNTPALKFYQSLGMEEAGLEVDGKVVRMKGFL